MNAFRARPSRWIVFGATGLCLFGLSLRLAPGRPVVHLQELLSGLDQPIAVKHAADGSGRLFVLERAGRIRIVEGGELRPTPFLDVSAQVDVIGEGGLTGLAFHPDFPSNGVFFVNYTASTAGTYRIVVSRFRTDKQSPSQADPAEEVILEIDHQTLIHNGGELAFGRDGYLYISVGDGAFMAELGDLAQDLSSLSGKILRIDVDQDPYGIPSDNPFVGKEGARGEIWAYGFRNPFRMSFDRLTGRLYVGDVGERDVEEIDLVVRGGNYGWRNLEGDRCFPRFVENCDREGFVAPIAVYGHDDGMAVIGGLVYRGETPTDLWGSYLFSDFVSGRVWELREVSEGRFRHRQVGLLGLLAASWGEDETGEILIPGFQNGKLFKLLFSWFENHAQVVSGVFGGLRLTTRFDFHNLGDQPARGVLRFLNADGQPQAVMVHGGSTSDLPIELGSGESSSLTLDPERNRFQGWALSLTDGPLSSSVHFLVGETGGREPVPVSTVSSSTWSKRSRVLIVREGLLSAAFAIVNPWNEPASVGLLLSEDLEIARFDLDPLQQLTFHLATLEGIPPEYQGPVLLESDEEVAVTAVATVGGLPVSGLSVVALD